MEKHPLQNVVDFHFGGTAFEIACLLQDLVDKGLGINVIIDYLCWVSEMPCDLMTQVDPLCRVQPAISSDFVPPSSQRPWLENFLSRFYSPSRI